MLGSIVKRNREFRPRLRSHSRSVGQRRDVLTPLTIEISLCSTAANC